MQHSLYNTPILYANNNSWIKYYDTETCRNIFNISFVMIAPQYGCSKLEQRSRNTCYLVNWNSLTIAKEYENIPLRGVDEMLFVVIFYSLTKKIHFVILSHHVTIKCNICFPLQIRVTIGPNCCQILPGS